VLGDYGVLGAPERDVSNLIKAFGPDQILTVGDNNYPNGASATIDFNIGFLYSDFIGSYTGAYGPGASTNRFFPALGNHDWRTAGAQPYLDYFSLPGNERYYEVRLGSVHFFILDSDAQEADGIDASSIQGQWLQGQLAASKAPFKLVLLHHAPFSSALHGPQLRLQWPFAAWGADAVLSGHEHSYERFDLEGIPYIVSGLGGSSPIYNFKELNSGSVQEYNNDYGALLAEVHGNRIHFQFASRDHIVFDDFSIFRNDPTPAPEVIVLKDAQWRYSDDGFAPPAAWTSLGFDDSAWSMGSAKLGYGKGDENTVVSYGGDPNNRHISTYFRHSFNMVNPGQVDRLRLELRCDDGAVVYLNGTEIHRRNMPGSTILNSTQANKDVVTAQEDSFFEFDVDPALLLSGANQLAVSVHQFSPSSSDLGFALAGTLLRDQSVLLPMGSSWRYFDSGGSPGRGWQTPNFDDSAWPQGPAELGYGDGDESTLLSFGPNAQDKYPSAFFRTSFSVTDPSLFTRLALHALRDDGIVVYLNGREVYRNNLPQGAIAADQLAGLTVAQAEETRFLESFIQPKLLRMGNNTLAVEIHQAAPTSSDLSFDLELLGR